MISLPSRVVRSPENASKVNSRRHHDFHRHAQQQNLSRRQFLQAGFALVGAAAGAGLLQRMAFAAPSGTGIPPQVTGFSPLLKDAFGVEIPFFLPVEVDPFTGSPEAVSPATTIWDFNGFIGMVEADGVSDPAQTSDDEPRRWACDIRFMKGVFVDRQGRTQRGAFGFFWLDVFVDPSLGPFASEQLHDFNPGDLNVPGEPDYFMDGGLFWTRRVPESSIDVALGSGDATFALSDFALHDYFNVVNAILRVGPPPIPASASVDVRWNGTGERVKVQNRAADFAGQYENSRADVHWSATNANGYTFSTANSSTRAVTHALVADVRTGSFHQGKN